MWRAVVREAVITAAALLLAEYVYRAFRIDRVVTRAFPALAPSLSVVPFDRRGQS